MPLLFLFGDNASTLLYTLSLHDALPISSRPSRASVSVPFVYTSLILGAVTVLLSGKLDRKSTRLNSSHRCISYAVFCLKKKKPDDLRHVLYASGELRQQARVAPVTVN